MLAIKAAGFDSCPMEGLDPDKVRSLFGLPQEATVTMAVSVGQRASPKASTVPACASRWRTT